MHCRLNPECREGIRCIVRRLISELQRPNGTDRRSTLALWRNRPMRRSYIVQWGFATVAIWSGDEAHSAVFAALIAEPRLNVELLAGKH